MTTAATIATFLAIAVWGLICGRIGYVIAREGRDVIIPGTDPDDWRGQ